MKNLHLWIFILAVGLFFVGCDKEDEVILSPNAGRTLLDLETDGYKIELAAGSVVNGQSGIWRIYSGANGRFDDVNDPHSMFYGEPGEIYSIGWEVSEKGQYKADVITISFKALSPAVLKLPADSLIGNVSMYLEAKEPKFGATGNWEIVEGEGGRIENADSANASFIGKANTTYMLSWTMTFGTKSKSVNFTFSTDELKANAGVDNLDIITRRDETKFYDLQAYLPAGGTGVWELLKGQDGEIHFPEKASTVFEGQPYEKYQLVWHVQVDDYIAKDTVEIMFRGKWGTWTDERDGQDYRYAEVNGLEWMAENYNYKAAFSDFGRSWYYGQTSRADVKDGQPIETDEERKYYGCLYNYFAAVELAPPGWRLPTQKEFNELIASFGGIQYGFSKVMEGGETGLDLIYGGAVAYAGDGAGARDQFSSQGESGFYWTSDYTQHNFKAIGMEFYQQHQGMYKGSFPMYYMGMSVRYVRDIE